MSGNELFELLNSSGGIESVMKTPAGILIHRRSDEAVTVPEDARIVRAVSEGKELELILSSGTEELYHELTARLNEKQPLNLRRVLNKIMDALSGSLVPLLPMLMAAAMLVRGPVAIIAGGSGIRAISLLSTVTRGWLFSVCVI